MAFKCVQRPGERKADINNSEINSSSKYKEEERGGLESNCVVLSQMIDAPSLMCILWWISFESCWIQLALNFLLAWCLISHYYVPRSDIQIVIRWESVTGVIWAWECDPRVITPLPSLILPSHEVNFFSRIKESWFYILTSQVGLCRNHCEGELRTTHGLLL